MVNSYYYSGNRYIPRTEDDRQKGFWLGSAAYSAILGTTLRWAGRPFSKQLQKEHAQNHLYRDTFLKSLEVSGLDKKGVRIIPMEFSRIADDYAKGTNACYVPKEKLLKINTQKISIAGFHELGHAMNDLIGKSGKLLSKLRWPGRTIAGLMSYLALFSRPKPKEAPKDFKDHLKDNCGKIAFLSMLPTVFEEGLASYKGIKLARKSELAEPLIKNMKKLYSKALLTYIAHAVGMGLAVGASSMIMDYYTRPKKVESADFSLFS